MPKQTLPEAVAQRKLALCLLALVGLMYSALLSVMAFFPAVLQQPVMGHNITLGLPLAFVFMLSVFIMMCIYAIPRRRD